MSGDRDIRDGGSRTFRCHGFMMKRALIPLFFAFLALRGIAQPVGPSEALLDLSIWGGSNGMLRLYWLKSDGSYVTLRSTSIASGSSTTYASGATGTYTLKVNSSDPRLRDLTFDNAANGISLNFSTGRIGELSTFSWYAKEGEPPMLNTSTRASVTGDQPAITGFVVGGTKSRWVLVRAVGPTLAQFAVTDALSLPKLSIQGQGNTSFGASDERGTRPEWSAGFDAAFKLSGAFPLRAGSADGASLMLLPPGAYTALVTSGSGQSAGTILNEVYVLPFALWSAN